MKVLNRTLFCSLFLTAAACGSNVNANSMGGTPDAKSADTQTAQQSVDSAYDASEADAGTSKQKQKSFKGIALEATVGLAGCQGSITGRLGDDSSAAASLDANITLDASQCVGKRLLSGTERIEARWQNDGSRSVKVWANLIRTLPDKDTVTIVGSDSTGATPNWSIDANGSLSASALNATVQVNEHRTRKATDGNVVFDMTIDTDSGQPLRVSTVYSAGKAQSRVIHSGSTKVHHLRAGFTATHTFAELSRDMTGDCVCPNSGVLTQTVKSDDGTKSYVRTYTFTGCGKATVETSASTADNTANGSAQVSWDNCTTG